MSNMIQALIFDCFGVLITDAFQSLITEVRVNDPELGARLLALTAASDHGTLGTDEAARQAAALLGMGFAALRQKVAAGEVKSQAMLDFAGSFRPKYKTAVLSNVSVNGLERRFARGELGRYFDVVVASGEIGSAKPEAQAYEIVAQRLGVRLNECVMIDDRAEYCAGAEAVGMRSVQFQTLEQLQRDLKQLLNASRAE